MVIDLIHVLKELSGCCVKNRLEGAENGGGISER